MEHSLIQTIIFFVLVAFIPSLLWLIWIMKDSNNTLDFKRVMSMFLWGAIFAVIIAIILELIAPGFSPREYSGSMIFMVAVIAPFAEEFAKPLGLKFASFDIFRVQDGVILGATAGLGFAATENLLYELSAHSEGGWVSFWVVAVLRSIAACALHAGATAMTGQGYAWAKLGDRSILAVFPFFLLAVLIHGGYNYLVSSGSLLMFLAGIGLAIMAVVYTRYAAK